MVKIVGILNVTPDSFSDGGRFIDPVQAIKHAEQLFADGADLIDIGAESTRPGATELSADEEWSRLQPILPQLIKKYPDRLSLDTRHHKTALAALALGKVIINDVTGMNIPEMRQAVVDEQARVIISHLPGDNIQSAHTAPQLIDNVDAVKNDLIARAKQLEEMGLLKDYIIVDPGIGFGKTPELNQQLLEFGNEIVDYPVMLGYSRKRFLGENRLDVEPNLDAAAIAIANHADFIRVHDVAAHYQYLQSVK